MWSIAEDRVLEGLASSQLWLHNWFEAENQGCYQLQDAETRSKIILMTFLAEVSLMSKTSLSIIRDNAAVLELSFMSKQAWMMIFPL